MSNSSDSDQTVQAVRLPMSLIDAQYFWFGHEKVTYSMLEQTNFAFSVQEFEGKVVSVLRSVRESVQ
ncbi:hypothetical protein FYQ06_20580 [Salmonella enterica]|nr:hypothetical protein [Salmonella enterica]